MFDGIDLSRYEELSDRLRFGSRKCSDGLCCFITLEFAKDPIERSRTYSMAYYTRRMKDGKVIYEARRFACQGLDVSLWNGEITFGCREYDSKEMPVCCRLYPREWKISRKRGKTWREWELFVERMCTARDLQEAREKIKVYSFYLFNADKFPEFEEYAVDSEGRYLFVPVPEIPKRILIK